MSGFFANFIVGKDKSMVKVSFLGVLALYFNPLNFSQPCKGSLVELCR